MRKLAIIGASGHGKVIADIAVQNRYEEIVFFDDDVSIQECCGYPVIGKIANAKEIDADIIVGIGNPIIRKKIQDSFGEKKIATLIHPSAVIADSVIIGVGTVIMAGAVVNPGTRIGMGCIINTSSSVDHDCRVGNFVHVAVGSHLCGNVIVGEKTWIGAGTIVSNNISICGSCMLGAGSVVVKNIVETGTYIGTPARKIEKNEDT